MTTNASQNGLSQDTIQAAGFINSLGVGMHIAYTDGGYASLSNDSADLAYLGLNNVRDGVSDGENGSAPLSSYITLAQQGIKFTCVVAGGGALTTASLQAELGLYDQINEAVPGSIVAIEGSNEINNAPITFNGVGGLQGALDLQRALYAAVHADTNLAGVAVDYFTGYNAGSVAIGPDPTATAGLADYDTQHPYPNNGDAPEAWVTPSQSLGNESASTGYGPAVFTETGTVASLGVRRRSPLAGIDRWLAGIAVRSRNRACHYRQRNGPGAAGRPRVATSASAVICSSGGSPGSWPSLR